MRLTQLDVVNDCLSTMGEAPLNSVQTDHPLVRVAVRLLREANARVQSPGWWFNRETVVLNPDSRNNNVMVPNDFISVDPAGRTTHLIQRGTRLYDIAKRSVVFDEPVEVDFVRLVPFEELPWSAQDLVRAATLVRFLEAYDADEMRVQQVMADHAEAHRTCQNEHTRIMRPNVLSSGGIGRRRGSIRVTGGYPRGLKVR